MGRGAKPVAGAWIAVDFDGTLVVDRGWHGPTYVSTPIAPMVDLVRRLLAEGWEVRIFTARVWHDGTPQKIADAEAARQAIGDWCVQHLGRRLAVTNIKDPKMVEHYDDRCVQVERNTGRLIGRSERTFEGLDLGA